MQNCHGNSRMLADGKPRFAFYDLVRPGRRYNSALRAASRSRALNLIDAADGVLVAEFTDHSPENTAWLDGLGARALIEALEREPGEREFDAVMLPCPWAGIHKHDLEYMLTLLDHLGVSLWTPDTAGPVGTENVLHLRLLAEITRSSVA